MPPGATPAGPVEVPADRHAGRHGRGWLLPTVIAVAVALMLGVVGVAIGLLTQQDGAARSPQVSAPDQTGSSQPASDNDVPFRGFVLRQPSLGVRAEAVLSAPVTGYLPFESEVFIVCTTIGDVVEGPGAKGGPSIATPVWDKVRTAVDGPDLGFVPDAWVKTGTAEPQAGACQTVNSNQVGFGVLGPLEMTVGGTPVSPGSRKQRAVFAMLLINRNRVVGAEALIDGVWGPRAGQEVRASLHSYVSNLRRLLNDAGVDGRTVLAAAPPGYRLSVPDIDCDIGRFVREKTAGIRAAAAGQFESASRHLSAALAEWRGRVLEDLPDFEFVTSFAAALIEDEANVHTSVRKPKSPVGRAYAVINELEGLTAEHPYREPLQAQLIIAYYVAERQSDALDAYRRLKTALSKDMGVEPGPTIRALHERVLRKRHWTSGVSH